MPYSVDKFFALWFRYELKKKGTFEPFYSANVDFLSNAMQSSPVCATQTKRCYKRNKPLFSSTLYPWDPYLPGTYDLAYGINPNKLCHLFDVYKLHFDFHRATYILWILSRLPTCVVQPPLTFEIQFQFVFLSRFKHLFLCSHRNRCCIVSGYNT